MSLSKTVAVADADFPTLVEEVAKTKEEIVITKDGEPIARVVPAVPRKQMTLDELRNTVTFVGNVEDPVMEWDQEKW